MGLGSNDMCEEENMLEIADDDGFFKFGEKQNKSLLLLQAENEEENQDE